LIDDHPYSTLPCMGTFQMVLHSRNIPTYAFAIWQLPGSHIKPVDKTKCGRACLIRIKYSDFSKSRLLGLLGRARTLIIGPSMNLNGAVTAQRLRKVILVFRRVQVQPSAISSIYIMLACSY
jgi:hypothetical protein